MRCALCFCALCVAFYVLALRVVLSGRCICTLSIVRRALCVVRCALCVGALCVDALCVCAFARGACAQCVLRVEHCALPVACCALRVARCSLHAAVGVCARPSRSTSLQVMAGSFVSSSTRQKVAQRESASLPTFASAVLVSTLKQLARKSSVPSGPPSDHPARLRTSCCLRLGLLLHNWIMHLGRRQRRLSSHMFQ